MAEPTGTKTSSDTLTGPGGGEPLKEHGDALLERVPQEPTQPDESGSGTAGGDRDERTSGGSDASGLPVDDERRGERRKQRYGEGASEVSSLD